SLDPPSSETGARTRFGRRRTPSALQGIANYNCCATREKRCSWSRGDRANPRSTWTSAVGAARTSAGDDRRVGRKLARRAGNTSLPGREDPKEECPPPEAIRNGPPRRPNGGHPLLQCRRRVSPPSPTRTDQVAPS